MDPEELIAKVKAIKQETEDASVWDDGEDAPMKRIGRIDDLAFEILNQLKVEGYEK